MSTLDEAKALKKECGKSKAKNPFCPIVREYKKLQPFLEETERPFKFHPAPPRVPVVALFAEGAVITYLFQRRRHLLTNLFDRFGCGVRIKGAVVGDHRQVVLLE